MDDHSAKIPGLSEAPEPDTIHDTSQVFHALAEGFRLVLAAAEVATLDEPQWR